MKKEKGFTLIELLIVIGIIAILAAVVFVALDPLTRFRDARDSARWTDISGILSAVRVDQVDNGGSYIAAIGSLTPDTDYVIGTNSGAACTALASCDQPISAGNCTDLTGLKTEGYLGKIPVSPKGAAITWDDGKTGYYVRRNTNNSVTVGACESENTNTISVTR